MAKDSYWFKHDSNARNDVKIIKLRRQLGIEGYGIYFMLIEVLRDQMHHKLPLSSIPDLSYDFQTSEEKMKAVVLSYDLFEIYENTFFSARLVRQMDEYNEKKIKYIEAGKLGGQASVKRRLSKGQAIREDYTLLDNNINIKFDTFWDAYDKKVGEKEKLIKKWVKLSEEERTRIMDYIPKYKEVQPEKKYRKNPDTFLNNKGWNDELIGGFKLLPNSTNNEAQPILTNSDGQRVSISFKNKY